MAVSRIDSGIAVSEMKVVRVFSRNANSTIATTTKASRQHLLQVGDGLRDEVRLAELHAVRHHAARHAGLQLGQRRLDRARQADGVCAGLLGDGENHRGLPVHARLAALEARAVFDPRDLAQRDRVAPSRKPTVALRRSSSEVVRPMLRIRNSRPAWST